MKETDVTTTSAEAEVSDTVSGGDVAALAGVSVKTVSNVVNGYEHVRPQTRAKVQQAIDDLGYRPNLSARSLRRGQTGIIALAVPELTSAYFAEIARGVIENAEERGLTVLVDQTDGRRERELLVLQGIRSNLVDGAIFSPLALGRDDGPALRAKVPLVLLGERVFDGNADHVAFDNVAAARVAVEHLVARGRTQIAVIGAQNPRTAETAHLRIQGYRDAVRSAGLSTPAAFEVQVDHWHRADGAKAARRLLSGSSRPDAIFCCNDVLALGAIRELHLAGVRVPDDIAVVGIDDIEEAAFSTPSLSTVAPDKAALAKLSVQLLVERISNPSPRTAPRDIQVGFELIVRDSS